MLKAIERPGIFRLFLALLVFVDHASRFNLGTAAVYVFFVLSGYWICVMWNGRYSRARQPYVTYLVSRGWRLLPVFILCSAIAWAVTIRVGVVPADLNWPHQVISSLVLFGYRSLGFQANGPAWSLDVEAQFYVVAPLLIFLLNRNLWWLAAFAGVSAVFFLLSDAWTAAPYIVFFAIGSAFAISQWKPSAAVARGSMVFAILAIAALCVSPWKGMILVGAHPGPLHVYNDDAEVCAAILFIPWAIYTTGQRDTKLDGMFGDLSFLVYLLHWPILHVAVDTAGGSMRHRILATTEVFVVTMAASVLLWAVFDRPINRLRSGWVGSRLPASGDSH